MSVGLGWKKLSNTIYGLSCCTYEISLINDYIEQEEKQEEVKEEPKTEETKPKEQVNYNMIIEIPKIKLNFHTFNLPPLIPHPLLYKPYFFCNKVAINL